MCLANSWVTFGARANLPQGPLMSWHTKNGEVVNPFNQNHSEDSTLLLKASSGQILGCGCRWEKRQG